MTPGVLIYIFALAFFFMLSGRLLTTHTDDTRTFSTPFHCLLSGIGIWYLWFLLIVASLGASVQTGWWLFVVICLAFLLVLTKAFQGLREVEHFWTKVITTTALLAPALFWVADDIPTHITEFTQYMKNSSHLFQLEVLPTLREVERFAIANPHSPISNIVTTLPVHIMSASFFESAAAAFNLILLAVIAGGMVHASNTPIRWSNLPWVTASSLLGVTIFNPFFSPSSILSAQTAFPIAVVLFAGAFPLIREKPIPRGWATLPTAFILCLLTGMHESALIYCAFIMIFWLLRSFTEHPRIELKDVFGWSLLIGLPILSWLLWQNYLVSSEIPIPAETLTSSRLPQAIWNIITTLIAHPLALALIAGIIFFTVKEFLKVGSTQTWSGLVINKSWLIFPTAFILFQLVNLTIFQLNAPSIEQAQQSLWPQISHLQFVALLPLWMFYFVWYNNSQLKSLAYKSPWLLGLIVAAMLIMLQLSQERILHKPTIAPLQHTLQVARSMETSKEVSWGETIAVIDSAQTKDFYTHVLGYGLRNYSPVKPVTEWVTLAKGDRDAFHKALREQGVTKLWIHAPNDDVRGLFNSKLRSTHSYLFNVEEESFRLINARPHITYKEPYTP